MDALQIQQRLFYLSQFNSFPVNHVNYLHYLKSIGFEPKIIYDIGSCVLHWTKEAKKIWPDAKIILFDAFQPAEFLYSDYDYYVGVLSNTNNKIVKFYQNDLMPGGNSYYREIGSANANKIFPEDKYVELKTRTLDSIVNEYNFPLPDLIKIDVQGAEKDIIEGGQNTIKHCKRIIIELQYKEYNLGAPKAPETQKYIEDLGWICCDPLFCNNGSDGDYGFINKKSNE